MIRSREIALAVAAFGAAQVLFGAPLAASATANGAYGARHGALENPISRAAACGPEGGEAATSKACQAAVAGSAEGALAEWDELRVPGVAGRDRDVIPDGRLCSAGLPRFRGLDLPRGDWPATSLAAGDSYTFTYRATIPHKGTFRMYLTKDSYRPTRPLSWDDLEAKPFLEVTDPKLSGGAYRMNGRLPSGRAGRQMIYTIWQNSDTPDTYYSCSDVMFAAGDADERKPADEGGASAPDGEAAPDGAATQDPPSGARSGAVREAPAESTGGLAGTALVAGGGLVLLLCAGGVVALARRADRRAR